MVFYGQLFLTLDPKGKVYFFIEGKPSDIELREEDSIYTGKWLTEIIQNRVNAQIVSI